MEITKEFRANNGSLVTITVNDSSEYEAQLSWDEVMALLEHDKYN